MAIRSVLQKMLDQGGNGISPEEFEEVKSFTSTFPNSKGILQKMLDQGGNGISPEEFEQIKTWSSPGMIAAKQQANVPTLEQEAEKERNSGVLSILGGVAKDVGLTLGGQGMSALAGQAGTLIGRNPLEAIENTMAEKAGLPFALPLSPFSVTSRITKGVASLLPEGAQDALLVNPDNWLTREARSATQFYQGKKTALQQEAEKIAAERTAEQTTIGGKIYESTIGNPQQAASTALQSAPQLLVSGMAGRGLAAAGMGAKAAVTGAGLTGSSMQSADTWQDVYFDLLDKPDEIRKSKAYSDAIKLGVSDEVAVRKVARKQADEAMAISFAASAPTAIIPGMNAIEGQMVGQVAREPAKSLGKKILGAAGDLVGETAQEAWEEGSSAFGGNVAKRPILGTDLMEGVIEKAAAGGMLGAVMSSPVAAGHFDKSAPPQAGGQTPPGMLPTPTAPTPTAPSGMLPTPTAPGLLPTPTAPGMLPTPTMPTQAESSQAEIGKIEHTQQGITLDNMLSKQEQVDEDFQTLADQMPHHAETIKTWRAENPSGEADSFLEWLPTRAKQAAAEQVSQAPQVVEAEQKAQEAAAKVEAVAQAAQGDPTQAPPAGVTADEVREFQQNGPEALVAQAKAAEETARTVRQTTEKEIESQADNGDAKKGQDALNQARKERKAKAKDSFNASLKAMQDGSMEWDESFLAEHAQAAGIAEDAVKAKIASARARYAKMREKERQAGKTPKKPAKVPSKPKKPKNEAVTPQEVKDEPRTETGVGEAIPGRPSEGTPLDQPLGEALPGDAGLRPEDGNNGRTPDLPSPGARIGNGEDGGGDGGRIGSGAGPDGSGQPDGGNNAVATSSEEPITEPTSTERTPSVTEVKLETARIEHAPSPATDGGNFNATDEAVKTEKAGSVAQFNAHMDAIRLVKKLILEGRKATPEEKLVLGKWNGWGPLTKWAFPLPNAEPADTARHRELAAELTSEELAAVQKATLSAHYTSPEVVDAMWDVARSLGFRGGVVLEPAMGSGLFFGRMPRDLMDASTLRGVELDPMTAAIAQKLYDVADIQNTGFENYRIQSGSVSLAITNVPFGNMTISDERENHGREYIHNFFISKIVDKLAPGGIAIIITGKGTMDAMVRKAGGPEFRAGIDGKARFLGAVRLPETAFKGSASTRVVTDIIVVQKRAEGDSSPSAPWSVRKPTTSVDREGNSVQVEINEYFVENPENVLGNVVPGSLYSKATEPAETTVLDSGRDLGKEIRRILSGLNVDRSVDPVVTRTQEAEIASLKISEEIPPQSVIERDGKLFLVEEKGRAIPLVAPEAQQAVLRDAMPVKNALLALGKAQLQGAENLDELRKALNDAYDTFVKKHGPIHKNRRAIDHDRAYSARLLSLEIKNEQGQWVKSEIFTQNTQKKAEEAAPTTAHDALARSLQMYGRVDLDYMERESGIPVGDLTAELSDRIFTDPETGETLLDEQYLSGDIPGKIAIAKAKGMQRNVDALMSVMPEEIAVDEISIAFGQTWIPAEVHNRFLNRVGADVKVSYSEVTNKWTVRSTGSGNGFRYSGEGYSAEDMVNWVLTGKPPVIYKKNWNGDLVIDQPRTSAAQVTIQDFRRGFSEMMVETDQAQEWVKRHFNEKENVFVAPRSNGAHMTYPGMSSIWQKLIRKSQSNAVWRFLSSGNPVFLHHEVGTGKTAVFVAAAMELRRTGKATKPVYIILNHLMPTIEEEMLKVYPGGKFLVLTEDVVKGKKRGEALARAATGDWDIVVMAHSTCGLIPLSPKIRSQNITEEIAYLREALQRSAKNSKEFKEITKKMDALETELERAEKELAKDPGPFWDELGFDALMVDEAHAFKNLFSMTSRQIPGIATSDSKKAFDLFLKTRQMGSVTGGKHIMFGTGTPVTRSMVELHIWMRYLMPGVLKKLGVYSLDDFITMFGEEVATASQKVNGKIVPITQITEFKNLKPLLSAWAMMSDRATAASANVKRPGIRGGAPEMVAIPENHVVRSLMDGVLAEMEAIENKTSKRNILEMMTIAQKIGIDPRLIDPRNPDLPDSKINTAVRNVFDRYTESSDNKGVQIVWLDMGVPKVKKSKKADSGNAAEDVEGEGEDRINLYQDMKDKLVAKGIPEEEIQFIHDHTEKEAKKALSKRLNDGSVRILIASRPRAATGMNIQQRIYWMHHVDAQWNPAEMEQANGRGIRFGNTYEEVGISYYTQQGTLDGYRWQNLERKAKIIENFFSGNIQASKMDDMGMGSISASMAKAAASSDPSVFRFVEANRRLEDLKQAKSQTERTAKIAERNIVSAEEYVRTLEAEKALVGDSDVDLTAEGIELNGVAGADAKTVAKAIKDGPVGFSGSSVKLGTQSGVPVVLRWRDNGMVSLESTISGRKYSSRPHFAKDLNSRNLATMLADISPKFISSDIEARLNKANSNLEALREKASRKFTKEEELASLEKEVADLIAKIGTTRTTPSIEGQDPGESEIQQPDGDWRLDSMEDSNFASIRASSKEVWKENSIPEGSPDARHVGTSTNKRNGAKNVVFQTDDLAFEVDASNFLGVMKQLSGDVSWSYSEHRAYATDGESTVSVPVSMTRSSVDFARRIQLLPDAKPDEALGSEFSPEKVREAVTRFHPNPGPVLSEFQVGLNMVTSAEKFKNIIQEILGSGTVPSIAQVQALAERAQQESVGIGRAISLMMPAIEAMAMSEATKGIEINPNAHGELYRKKGYEFATAVLRMVEKSLPSMVKMDRYAAFGFFAAKFKESTGKALEDASLSEIENWANNRVVLNANLFPAWFWKMIGVAGVVLAGPMDAFGDVGAFDAIAVGVAAAYTLKALKWAWRKFLPSVNSPRAQIMSALSKSKVTGEEVIRMLDQAFLRTAEIKGPALQKFRSIKKLAYTWTGRERNPGLGREIANRIEGRGNGSVPGMSEEQIVLATDAMRSILNYFRQKMEALGMSVRGTDYVPIVYHHEGIKEAMNDPAARDALLLDITEKVLKHMPNSVQEEMDKEEEHKRDWNEDRRRRSAAMRVAQSIIDKAMGEGFDSKYGIQKKEYLAVGNPFTAQRGLPFSFPETVTDSKGREIPLVERNIFRIMESYIPKMSKSIAHKETVNNHRLNQWLDGLEPLDNEDRSKYRARMLNYLKADLAQSTTRVLPDQLVKFARMVRILNTVRYLGLSPWYVMRNLMFGVPLAFALTGFHGGTQYGYRAIRAMLGNGKEDARRMGAISDGVFHDVFAQDESSASRIFDVVNGPSAWSQEAVDVGGYYAGKAAAPRIFARAKKGDSYALKVMHEALGNPQQALDRGVLTDEEVSRIGLYFKMKISGTARSLNLPSFMGTDLGRTVFQFGSIPMEQTKTLVEDVFGNQMLNARTGKYAVGAILAGTAMIGKLWLVDALSQSFGAPEDKRKKWLRRHSIFDSAIYAMSQSGAFQILQPMFDKMDGYNKRAETSIDDYLPMPMASTASLAGAIGQGAGRAISMAKRDDDLNPLEAGIYVATPAFRDLVNQQTAMFRGFGVKIPSRTRLEKRIGKKD